MSPVEGGVTNWPPPAYSPDTGLFYVQEHNGFNMVYLTDPDPRGSMGLGGKTVAQLGSLGDYLTAIDYKTGKVAWRHQFHGGGGGGLLATAGGVLFSGDGGGNFVAFDATNGKPLWHSRIGNISNAPQTYSSTAASTCSSRSATRCTRSRCTDEFDMEYRRWTAHGRSIATMKTRWILSSAKSTLGSFKPFRPLSSLRGSRSSGRSRIPASAGRRATTTF